MRIGVDLDGVCYDFGKSMRIYLEEIGHQFPTRSRAHKTWDFHDEWGLTRDEFMEHFINGVNEGTVFYIGAAHAGTRRGLQRILDMGHSLHVITDRTVGKPGMSWSLTGQWIDRYLPKPIASVTFTKDKTVVPTDMMIDDKLSNYEELIAAGCDAWLFDRPWNQTPGRELKRVSSMMEFADQVEKRSL